MANKIVGTLLAVGMGAAGLAGGIALGENTAKQEYQEVVDQKDTQLSASATQLEQINSKLAEREEEIVLLKKDAETLQTEKQTLQISINEKDAKISELTLELENTDKENVEQIANLNSQIDTLKAEKVDLQTQLENKDEQITTLNTTITEKETALESLQSEYNELSTLHTELQEAYDNLESENSANEEEVNNLTGQIAVLNTRIQELETQLEASSGIEEVSEMPVASEDLSGVIYKYTGETNADFINGKFYVITLHNNVYSWTLVNEQDTPSADKGMVIAYLMTKSGEKLANVNVTLTNVDTSESYVIVTDSHGRISKEVDAGTYTISVAEIDGYTTPETQTITITANTVDYTNMVYESALMVSSVFGENDAATVAYVSDQIAANNMTSEDMYNTYGWSVGDTTDITLTNEVVIKARIIGVNHDYKSDGTGKAGLTLELVSCYEGLYKMYGTAAHCGGYVGSTVKTETLPSIKALLPQEWQDALKLVDKKSANGSTSNFSETITHSEDLFLLSEIEMFGTVKYAQDGANEGEWYEYYKTNNTAEARIKKMDTDEDGVGDVLKDYWLRSSRNNANFGFVTVRYDNGESEGVQPAATRGLSFAFCI